MIIDKYKKYLSSDIHLSDDILIRDAYIMNYNNELSSYHFSNNDLKEYYIYDIDKEFNNAINLKPNYYINQPYFYLIRETTCKLSDVLILLDKYIDFLPENHYIILTNVTIENNHSNIIYKPESKHLSSYDIYKPYDFYKDIKNFNIKYKKVNILFKIIQEIGIKILYDKKDKIYDLYGQGLYINIKIENKKLILNNIEKKLNINNIDINKFLKEIIPENILIKYKLKKINNDF